MQRVIPPDIECDVKGKIFNYDGNASLKPCNVSLSYTKEHIEEMRDCKRDWKYFAERHYHITSLDEGVIKVKTRTYQDDLINNFIKDRFNIVLASRQSGKSTSYEIFCLWYVLFQEAKTIAILANKLETAVGILSKIKLAYELLPKYLQQGVKKWNEKSIELENGCKIIASATSSSAIRSKAVNVLILDEMAFVPNKQWMKFYSSVYPTVSSSADSKIIIVSTPNGLNQFYKFWSEALKGIDGVAGKGNKFKPYRVDWWQVPGRDEAWKAETIANTSVKEFASEFGNDFLGSSSTLIEGFKLTSMVAMDSLPTDRLYGCQLPKKYRHHLSVFHMPEEGHVYSASVDSAKMTENSVGDSISINILDITTFPFNQVATFLVREGMSYLEVPEIVEALGRFYNDAYLFIENNEGSGQSIADSLAGEYEYENVYYQKEGVAGYRTSKKTKRLGCSNLSTLIENDRLRLNDFNTISQLATFVKVKDTYKADGGYQDDAVMSLIGSIFFMQDKEFEGIHEVDYVKGVLKREENESNEDSAGVSLIVLPSDSMEEENQDATDWSWMYG